MCAQICFPRQKVLPGEPNPPIVDGFVEPEEFQSEPVFGQDPSQVDPGWSGAVRITYDMDSGQPLMVFQGVKHPSDDLLYLSFVVRRDTDFNVDDRIILVFVDDVLNWTSKRRIDIQPNSTNGAGSASLSPGDNIRADRLPCKIECRKWIGTGWDLINDNSDELVIKARSWDLGGANNKNWSVEVQVPTTKEKAGNNADWIDLEPEGFGFYMNVIRICSGQPECGPGPEDLGGNAFQFIWPRETEPISGATDVSEVTIPDTDMGTAYLGDVSQCSGVTGVKFVDGIYGIGTRPSLPDAPLSNKISGTDTNTFVAKVKNNGTDAATVRATFRIANWGIGPGNNSKWNKVPADDNKNPTDLENCAAGTLEKDLEVEWTLDSDEQKLYYGDPTTVPPTLPSLDDHQCIWVLLDGQGDFVENSMRRNMNFESLSELEQMAGISGVGHPSLPAGVTDHDFLLLVSQMRRTWLVTEGEDGCKQTDRSSTSVAPRKSAARYAMREFKMPTNILGRTIALVQHWLGRIRVQHEWVWIMDGYRRTEHILTIDEKRYRIYDPVGSFGYIGEHTGLVQEWQQSVAPTDEDEERFSQVSGNANAYRLRVPDEGVARIVTKLKAVEFTMPWWVWLILLIIIGIIIAVIRFLLNQ